ncbi:helix-turn-helix transcriptional regulator [Paracoccus sp. KR1-242]|uniref:helix-turn-helix transcriptional regulator n=1 Tax=Paracoccus sp. KR1-242 TaxID=3410028 RepID=UPI003BFC46F2
MQTSERLLRDQDAAAALGVSKTTFWRLTKDGTVPRPIKIGASSRWPQSEILAVIERAKAARAEAA